MCTYFKHCKHFYDQNIKNQAVQHMSWISDLAYPAIIAVLAVCWPHRSDSSLCFKYKHIVQLFFIVCWRWIKKLRFYVIFPKKRGHISSVFVVEVMNWWATDGQIGSKQDKNSWMEWKKRWEQRRNICSFDYCLKDCLLSMPAVCLKSAFLIRKTSNWLK